MTAAERAVALLLVDGKTSPEIARELKKSERTVEAQRSAILHKMGARNVVVMVRIAIREGHIQA